MPANSHIWGVNDGMSTLRLATGVAATAISPGSRSKISNLTIDGFDTASSVGVNPDSAAGGVVLDRVTISDFPKGVLLDSSAHDGFEFGSGRITSCGTTGLEISTTVSNVRVHDSKIDANGTNGILCSGGASSLAIRDNEISANGGYGIRFTGSLLAPLVDGNTIFTNTTADFSADSLTRSGRFTSNYCIDSPICVNLDNTIGFMVESNTLSPSGGATDSIAIGSGASRTVVGQNVYLAGAFDLSTHNNGFATRYLGTIYASGDPDGTGPWERGERVYNAAPSTGTASGWVCTVGHDTAATFIPMADDP
jgi:hypothetical protein